MGPGVQQRVERMDEATTVVFYHLLVLDAQLPGSPRDDAACRVGATLGTAGRGAFVRRDDAPPSE